MLKEKLAQVPNLPGSYQMKTQVLFFAYTATDALPSITETVKLFFVIVMHIGY